nr:hypothetical protein [Nitrospirota bacterium]
MGKILSILETQLFWGVFGLMVTVLTTSVALSGKYNVSASRILLVFAWLIAVGGIYVLIPSIQQNIHPILRSLYTLLGASMLGIGLFYLSQWYDLSPGVQPVPASTAKPPSEPTAKVSKEQNVASPHQSPPSSTIGNITNNKGIITQGQTGGKNTIINQGPSAREIAREISGGKNFCYFSLYFINNKPQIIDGKFQLAMTGVGVVEKVNYWISPAGVEPTGKPNDPYYSIDSRKMLLEIVHDGGRAWDRALPLGEYRIDFAAKNGNWYERLKIYMSNGEVKQSVTVTNAKGDVIYDSESPKKK